ncbi:MAG: hypothetical protein J5857_06925 [Treponema sp.]|nr:hypothetical protein [Treponema sp.]
MKKFFITLALVFAFPVLASAVEAEHGTIYSVNGYGHFGTMQGYGLDFGATFHTRPDNDISPIIYFSFGFGGLDNNFYLDLNLLGGVSWHLTSFFYADLAGGVQGFMQLGEQSQLGGAFVADASVLLHLAELIGLRAGCMVSFGTNGSLISPHVGLSSVFDFSWLFN